MINNKTSITDLHNGLKNKDYSARDIAKYYLDIFQQKNSELNAFLRLDPEKVLTQAELVDSYISDGGDIKPLTGVPVAIKDNIQIKGEITTCASKILENYVSPYDAGVIKKLKNEKAVLFGKTNLDEFAMGSSCENSAYGPTKNPVDITKVAGGSSGGSTSAVGGDLVPVALGSDTGGSIRLPAHFCGVVGLKPTYGAVSRSGLVALASSLDQIGPITRSVEDAELVFEAISGYDPYDNTSTQYEYNQTSVEEVKKLRIGLPKQYFPAELSSEVKTAVNDVISFYESQGFSISMIDMPHTEYGLAAYYIIQPAEASSNLSRFDGIRYAPVTGVERSQHDLKNLYIHNKTLGFGKETKRRIILGTYVLSSGYYDAYYKKAQEAREYIKDDFNNAFEKVDVLLSPVSPTPAFNLGEKINDPVAMYLTDILTIPTNLAGLPAISIPVKTNTHPLPIGFQLIGKHFKENDIIGLGKLYEKSL